jgi:hypothetical protein
MSPPLFSPGVPCGSFLSGAPEWIGPWLCDTNPWNAVHLSTGAIVYGFVGDPFVVIFLNALFEAFEYTVGELETKGESFFQEYYIEHVLGDPFVTIYGMFLVTTVFWNRRWAPGYPQIARWHTEDVDVHVDVDVDVDVDRTKRGLRRKAIPPREDYRGSTLFWLPERLTPTYSRAPFLFQGALMAVAATLIVNLQGKIKADEDGTFPRVAFAPAILIYYAVIVLLALSFVHWNARARRAAAGGGDARGSYPLKCVNSPIATYAPPRAQPVAEDRAGLMVAAICSLCLGVMCSIIVVPTVFATVGLGTFWVLVFHVWSAFHPRPDDGGMG